MRRPAGNWEYSGAFFPLHSMHTYSRFQNELASTVADLHKEILESAMTKGLNRSAYRTELLASLEENSEKALAEDWPEVLLCMDEGENLPADREKDRSSGIRWP